MNPENERVYVGYGPLDESKEYIRKVWHPEAYREPLYMDESGSSDAWMSSLGPLGYGVLSPDTLWVAFLCANRFCVCRSVDGKIVFRTEESDSFQICRDNLERGIWKMGWSANSKRVVCSSPLLQFCFFLKDKAFLTFGLQVDETVTEKPLSFATEEERVRWELHIGTKRRLPVLIPCRAEAQRRFFLVSDFVDDDKCTELCAVYRDNGVTWDGCHHPTHPGSKRLLVFDILHRMLHVWTSRTERCDYEDGIRPQFLEIQSSHVLSPDDSRMFSMNTCISDEVAFRDHVVQQGGVLRNWVASTFFFDTIHFSFENLGLDRSRLGYDHWMRVLVRHVNWTFSCVVYRQQYAEGRYNEKTFLNHVRLTSNGTIRVFASPDESSYYCCFNDQSDNFVFSLLENDVSTAWERDETDASWKDKIRFPVRNQLAVFYKPRSRAYFRLLGWTRDNDIVGTLVGCAEDISEQCGRGKITVERDNQDERFEIERVYEDDGTKKLITERVYEKSVLNVTIDVGFLNDEDSIRVIAVFRPRDGVFHVVTVFGKDADNCTDGKPCWLAPSGHAFFDTCRPLFVSWDRIPMHLYEESFGFVREYPLHRFLGYMEPRLLMDTRYPIRLSYTLDEKESVLDTLRKDPLFSKGPRSLFPEGIPYDLCMHDMDGGNSSWFDVYAADYIQFAESAYEALDVRVNE